MPRYSDPKVLRMVVLVQQFGPTRGFAALHVLGFGRGR
jgi:hypothetical protein